MATNKSVYRTSTFFENKAERLFNSLSPQQQSRARGDYETAMSTTGAALRAWRLTCFYNKWVLRGKS